MIEAVAKDENIQTMTQEEHKQTISIITSRPATDLDYYLNMLKRSEFGTYVEIREGEDVYIDYDGDRILTQEVVLEKIDGVGEFVAVFCASDGSFITNVFTESNKKMRKRG